MSRYQVFEEDKCSGFNKEASREAGAEQIKDRKEGLTISCSVTNAYYFHFIVIAFSMHYFEIYKKLVLFTCFLYTSITF